MSGADGCGGTSLLGGSSLNVTAHVNRDKARFLVSRLTNPRGNESAQLATGLLSELKNLCKEGNANVTVVWQFLQTSLCKPSSLARYLALQICELLFSRSSHFRMLLVDNFNVFKQNTLEINVTNLPPPSKFAKLLHELSVRCIEEWKEKFSAKYPLLNHEYKKLENIVKFPSEIEKEKRKTSEKQEKIIELKMKQIVKELRKVAPLLESVLDEMENSYELLVPSDPAIAINRALEVSPGPTVDNDFPFQCLPAAISAENTILPPASSQQEIDDFFASFGPMEDESEEEEEEESDQEESEEDEEDSPTVDYDFQAHQALKRNGIMGADYELEITINGKTNVCVDQSALEPILDHLIDCIKQLEKEYKPILEHWKWVFKDIPTQNHPTRETLFSFISSFSERLASSISQFHELNIPEKYKARAKMAATVHKRKSRSSLRFAHSFCLQSPAKKRKKESI